MVATWLPVLWKQRKYRVSLFQDKVGRLNVFLRVFCLLIFRRVKSGSVVGLQYRKTSGAMSLSARYSFFPEVCGGRRQVVQKAAPRRAKHLSCRPVHPAELRADGCPLPQVWLPTVPSSKKQAVQSTGLLMDSACARPPEMAPSRPRAKRSGPGGSPCCTPLSLGIFCGPNRPNLSVDKRKSQYVARPSATRRISRGTQVRSILVEGVLKVHGQEAPLVVVVVFPKPTWMDGFTAIFGSEPQCLS